MRRTLSSSWKEFAKLNIDALDLVYEQRQVAGRAGRIVTATDNRTVVMKLKQPDSSLFHLLVQRSYIAPRESEGGFRPQGRGPRTWGLGML